ncbi:hypothetical protein LTR66_010595 [Elasticomyces elasticus]|nr:hypothetical protein LTR66_010595 [Elasticomyces elasticus]
MAGKRKRSVTTAATAIPSSSMRPPPTKPLSTAPIPLPSGFMPKPPPPNPPERRTSARGAAKNITNPDINGKIIDAPDALRASPDSDVNEKIVPGPVKYDESSDESPLSDVPEVQPPNKKKALAKTGGKAKATTTTKAEIAGAGTALQTPSTKKSKTKGEDDPGDPEAEGEEEADEEELKEALSRPPPVNSDYLPLPWKGRLGYACLNTYLRQSNPPVFQSRTCRIASILEHRHPLRDSTQPEHPTKNRPDRDQPADPARGMAYVEEICLANVRDIAKMIRWNDRYGIRFLRLSSEMFPFASHEEYGYKLAPFASEALAEAGKVIAQYGHRVTTHPGQFTQLGSPRKSVIENAFRDLAYHDELLSLLKLPKQHNKDAVMILHMGGMFGDKEATLNRFRENYAKLPQSVKNRLVLENDDVIWSVHDLLPVCEELNIPMVLDFHHHNIIFDPDQIREGTKDIVELFPRIKATWDRKGIRQKMHYSEPTPAAITGRQRRKHNPRVATLPPCAPDMDLMIEAKDKEQAVFELMRTFKLPGYDTFNDIVPYVRNDDNKAALANGGKGRKTTPKNGKKGKRVKGEADEDAASATSIAEPEDSVGESSTLIPDEEVGMGGPEGRVYWPPGMEEWLRPKKREVKKKDPSEASKLTLAQKRKAAAAEAAANAATLEHDVKAEDEEDSDVNATPATKKAKASLKAKAKAKAARVNVAVAAAAAVVANTAMKAKPIANGKATRKPNGVAKGKPKPKKEPNLAPTPSTSDDGASSAPVLETDDDQDSVPTVPAEKARPGVRKSGRAKGAVKYRADEDTEMER